MLKVSIRKIRVSLSCFIVVVSGYIDPGEDPLMAAKRVLHEETGCTATEFVPIQTVWMGPGNSGGQMHLLVGCVALDDALQFAGRALEHEDIAIHPMTRTQFLDALNTGALSNWSTVICAAWLAQQGAAIKTQWTKLSK